MRGLRFHPLDFFQKISNTFLQSGLLSVLDLLMALEDQAWFLRGPSVAPFLPFDDKLEWADMDVDGLEFCAVSVLYKVITSVTGFIWIWSVHIALYVDVSNTI